MQINVVNIPSGIDYIGTPYDFDDNFLNLIVTQSAINSTLLDDSIVAATNFVPIGMTGYYGAQINLTNSLAYQTGPLGGFYQPTNSPLIDKGSTAAATAGLSEFTTLTSQLQDTNKVDIGYHYFINLVPPIPNDASQAGCPNVPNEFMLTGWSSNSSTLYYTIVSHPVHGTLTNDATMGSAYYIYTPTNNYEGTDSFTFTVSDGYRDSTNAATVTLTTGDPGLYANYETVMTGTNQSLNITLTVSNPLNCTNLVTYTILNIPTNGNLSGTGSNVIYTPNTNYEGVDNFIFTANDIVATNSAEVTIFVVAGPTNLTAQCQFNQILLGWSLDDVAQQVVDDVNNLEVLDFNIYRSTNHGGPYAYTGTSQPDENFPSYPYFTTNYVDVAVSTNTTYYYVVTFQYSNLDTGVISESLHSGEASASACSLPSPIRTGFNQNIIGPNDDDSYIYDAFHIEYIVTNLLATIGFPVNYFGTTYTNLYVNCNGNVTFGNYLPDYTPVPLVELATNVIASFWADVDTRGANSGLVTYGTNTISGNLAFGANWIDVGYYAEGDDKLNVFQLILINRPDRTNGDYDVEFNYAQVQWDEGNATGGEDGLSSDDTYPARAGYASASGSAFEFNGSGVSRALLDTNLVTGLIHTNFNSNLLGRYVVQFHNGISLGNP